MAAPYDLMTKANNPGGLTSPRPSRTERRASRRCKITQLMRIRPSDPEREHFIDIRGSISVSRSGVFFHSSESKYEVGMRLFVTMPYTKEPSGDGSPQQLQRLFQTPQVVARRRTASEKRKGRMAETIRPFRVWGGGKVVSRQLLPIIESVL